MFIFIGIILLTILSFNYIGKDEIPKSLIFFLKYHVFFMFAIAILGVMFGSLTQIMTSRKIETSYKKFDQLKDFYLKSLQKNELRIITYLIQNNGLSTQYELTKLEGLNKLKTSRIIVDLENKGLIEKRKIGKINKIFLNSNLYKILK